MKTEKERQIMHLLVGLATIAMLFVMGRPFTAGAVFFVIVVGTLMINARIQGLRIPFVEWFVQRFERKDILFPGFGSACYASGVLIPMVFLIDVNQVASCVLVLALGDGLSTMIGRKGKHRLPYNQEKTLEGALAFFIGSLSSVFFIGIMAIPLAALAAIAETINLRIDDNLTVPIACTIFFLVVS